MLHISKHDAHSGNVIMFALLPHSLSFIVLLQLINPFHCAVHVMPHLLWPEFSRLAGTRLVTDGFFWVFFRRIMFELCSGFPHHMLSSGVYIRNKPYAILITCPIHSKQTQ